jgi:hypothetical protein
MSPSPYVRHTVDVEELFTLVLRDHLQQFASVFGKTEMQVMAQQDVDAIEHVPFVVVTALNGRMLNGPNAWEWDVFVSILGLGRDDAADLADMVYVGMHQSHDRNARYPGVGAVTSVDDVSMPSKTSTTLTPAGDLTQYDGQFHVVVRKI